MKVYKLNLKEKLFGKRYADAKPQHFDGHPFGEYYEEIADWVQESPGFIFAPVGTGKTFFAASLIEHDKFIDLESVEYIHARMLHDEILRRDFRGENYKTYIYHEFNSKFLIVDNIFKEFMFTPLFSEAIWQLIVQRNMSGKGTLLLSDMDSVDFNYFADEKLERYSRKKFWEFLDAKDLRREEK